MNRTERRQMERAGEKGRPYVVRRLPTDGPVPQVRQPTTVNATYEDNSRVVIGYLAPGEVAQVFCDSLVHSWMYDAQTGAQLLAGTISIECGPRVHEGRNQIIRAFMNQPEFRRNGQPRDWLFMADSDMAWDDDAIHRLVATAEEGDEQGRPIHVIGGLCFAGNRLGMYPTIYALTSKVIGGVEYTLPRQVDDYPRDTLVRVGATGAAFLLIHRDVLLSMWLRFKDHPHPWFVEGTNRAGQFGEDIAFCIRAQACGFGVYVDTRVKVGHMKRWMLDEGEWDRNQARYHGARDQVLVS